MAHSRRADIETGTVAEQLRRVSLGSVRQRCMVIARAGGNQQHLRSLIQNAQHKHICGGMTTSMATYEDPFKLLLVGGLQTATRGDAGRLNPENCMIEQEG